MGILSKFQRLNQVEQKHRLIAAFCLLLFIWFFQYTNAKNNYEKMERSYEYRITELEQQIATQQEAIEAKQDYIEQMNSDIASLNSDVSRFEYENWRWVVPDVYEQSNELYSNIQSEP